MLFTQNYNSLSEIDPEFYFSLETLLEEEMISIQALQDHESSTPENIHFQYFLFFSTKNNAPVGFMLIHLIPVDHGFYLPSLKSFAKKIFSKQKSALMLEARIPGVNSLSYLFLPEFQEEGEEEVLKVVNEIREKRKIVAEKWHFNAETSETEDDPFVNTREKVQSYILANNYKSYAHYHNQLAPSVGNQIKELWQEIIQYKNYSIAEYNDFKDIFRDKKDGLDLYRDLKKNPILKNARQKESLYLTFEDGDRLLGIITLSTMKNHHILCDFLPNISQSTINLDAKIYFQYAIMRFLEKEGQQLTIKKDHAFSRIVNEQDLRSMNLKPFTNRTILQSPYSLSPKIIEKTLSSSSL